MQQAPSGLDAFGRARRQAAAPRGWQLRGGRPAAWLLCALLPSLCCRPAPAAAGPGRWQLQAYAVAREESERCEADTACCLQLRGAGVTTKGMSSVAPFSRRARDRRLAKHAAKRSRPGRFASAAARRQGAEASARPAAWRAAQPRHGGPDMADASPEGMRQGQARPQRAVGEAVRELMKAVERGCGDAELQRLMARVRHDHGYGKQGPHASLTGWPPDPDLGESAPDVESWNTNQSATPRGLLELRHSAADIDSDADSSISTEDSLSDEQLSPPAPLPLRLISGSTRIPHAFPAPLTAGPTAASSAEESSSDDAKSSSETSSAEERGRQTLRYPEYEVEERLATDPEFQRRLMRWREGLPNWERTRRPACSTAAADDEHDSDSKYEYVGSRDEAAEPLDGVEAAENCDALGPSFRCAALPSFPLLFSLCSPSPSASLDGDDLLRKNRIPP